MKIDIDKCMSCGMCIEYCPSEAIVPIHTSTSNNGYLRMTIDQNMCVDCKECLQCDCPGDALHE